MKNMNIIYNNKHYIFIDNENIWKVKNKKGNYQKVTSDRIIKELNYKKDSIELKKTPISYEDKKELGTEGLGDVISNVTSKLGIKECDGCEERKKKLNKRFNWMNKTRDLTEDEIKFVVELKNKRMMSKEESNRLFSLYNEITNSKLKWCRCSGLILKMIERLNNLI